MKSLGMLKTPKRDKEVRIPAQDERSPVKDEMASAPAVGVFFVHGNNLWIDSTPADEAPLYGDMRSHDGSHEDYWEQLRAGNAAPKDEEYDECPRGRVCYDTKQRVFRIYLDKCIRERRGMVFRIIRAMNLPPTTRAELDSHYKCPKCRD